MIDMNKQTEQKTNLTSTLVGVAVWVVIAAIGVPALLGASTRLWQWVLVGWGF